MFRTPQLSSLWRIVSQVNVEEIQKEIEAAFHLLILGDREDAAEQMARLLSDPEGAAVHPWITVGVPPLEVTTQGLDRVDLALLVAEDIDLSPGLAAVRGTLASAGIPTLVVITGPAARLPGAALVRRGEGKRRAAPVLDAAAIQSIADDLLQMAPQGLQLALARRLPPLRAGALRRLIQETAQANALYSFSTGLAETVPVLDIPLNMGDLIVLTKNQLVMAYQIALVAGKEGAPQQLLGEIVGVLGGGFLFRQMARQLIGLVPVWGIVPKVAIAYAGTWVIGQAIGLWAVEGQRITPALLSQFYAEALERGQQAAREIAGGVRKRIPPHPDSRPAPVSTTGSPGFWDRLRRRIPLRRR